MKAEIFVRLMAAALILATAGVGCKKRVQGTTPLPGSKPGVVGEAGPSRPITDTTPAPAPPIVDTTPKAQPIPDEGLGPAPNMDELLKWDKNREVFKDQTVYFEFDKSIVKASELPKLQAVASQMKSTYQGKALLIEGHCDERGTEEYNRSLGERRALSVREQLVTLGLDPNMVATITYGEDQPADPAHNDAAWQKNRRGEIILLSRPGGAANP